MTNLFKNQTTNDNSVPIISRGFQGNLDIWGVLDGGTITIQSSPDSEITWLDLLFQDGSPAGVFTAVGKYPIGVPVVSGDKIRAVLSGAGGSADVNVRIL